MPDDFLTGATGTLAATLGGYQGAKRRNVQRSDKLGQQGFNRAMQVALMGQRQDQFSQRQDVDEQQLDLSRRKTVFDQWWPIMQAAMESQEPKPPPTESDLKAEVLREALEDPGFRQRYINSLIKEPAAGKAKKPSIVPQSISGGAALSFPGGGGIGAGQSPIDIDPVTGAMNVQPAAAQPQLPEMTPADQEAISDIQAHLQARPGVKINWTKLQQDNPDLNWESIMSALK